MRLKEARLEVGMVNKCVVKQLRTLEPQFDESLLSKCERGIVRPTPKELFLMCDLYGTTPDQVFEPQELDYGIDALQSRRTPKKDTHKLRRKLTVRLNPWADGWLQPHILQACGYRDKSDWTYACIRRLAAQYAAINGHKKNRPGLQSEAAR